MSFFGVHNHSAEGSNLRLRDSINKIPEMIEYAHSLGHSGICFTEHESITSSLDALKYYDSHKDLEGWEGFKVVLGNEIYLLCYFVLYLTYLLLSILVFFYCQLWLKIDG